MHAAKAIYQPSSSDRTINCPGWWDISKNLDPVPTSEHALRGTLAHSIGEVCLNKNVDADNFIGKKAYMNKEEEITFAAIPSPHWYCTVTEEMALAVQVYLDEVRRVEATMPMGEFLIEQYLKMDWLVRGLGGTADHIAIDPGTLIHCHDYKHGSGKFVDIGEAVGDNAQTSIYTLGAVGKDNPHKVEEAIATIVQPRHYRTPVIRSVEFKVKDLIEWGYDVVAPAIAKAKKLNAPLKWGSWCSFCPAQFYARCPEKNRSMFEKLDDPVLDSVLNLSSESTEPVDYGKLSGAQIDYILKRESFIKEQLGIIHAEAYRRLEQNDPDSPTESKLVQGNAAKRRWVVEEDAVLKTLSTTIAIDSMTDAKLKSPAVIEKLLLRVIPDHKVNKILRHLVNTGEKNKPLMVSVGDSRPVLADKLFDNLEEKEYDPMA